MASNDCQALLAATAADVEGAAAAASSFRQAADAGNTIAALELALLYREGRGVEQSHTRVG